MRLDELIHVVGEKVILTVAGAVRESLFRTVARGVLQ